MKRVKIDMHSCMYYIIFVSNYKKENLPLMRGVSNPAYMTVNVMLFSPLPAVISLTLFFPFSDSPENTIVAFFFEYFSK